MREYILFIIKSSITRLKATETYLDNFWNKIFEALDLLHQNGIVHADLKSDNILVKYDENEIKDLRIIDFGSAFIFETAKLISMSTPEYLAPEILDYLENSNQPKYREGASSVFKNMKIWSYDMWSVGALLLEIITGFPLWLSLKGRAKTLKGRQIFGWGLFGVQGRDWSKIYQKQKLLLDKDLTSSLIKYDTNGYEKDDEFLDLLQNLLQINPLKRISAKSALCHPFMTS